MFPPTPDWLAFDSETPAAFLPTDGPARVNAAWRERDLPEPTTVIAEGLNLTLGAGKGRRVVPGLCVALPAGRLALVAPCDIVPEAVILHEVRNLATTVLAVTDELAGGPVAQVSPDRIADLLLAVGQLATVLGAGSPEAPARCDLVAAVHAAVRLSRDGLAVPVVFEPGVPASGAVALRAGDVLQIVLNLVQNAAAAVRRLPGADPVLRVRLRTHEDGFTVRVADRGVGLGEGNPEHFFVPGRSDRGSTGLGLAAARALAIAAGGGLRLEAREGGGAVAILELPRLTDGRAPRDRRQALRVAPAPQMSAEVSLPGTRFGARVADWSAGGMRLRGGGLGVPVGARGRARLRRASGLVHEVAIEVVRLTDEGDPCYRFLPALPSQPAVWLHQDLSLVGAEA